MKFFNLNFLMKFKLILNETPLHFAVLKGNTSIVDLLLFDQKVDANMMTQSSILYINIF